MSKKDIELELRKVMKDRFIELWWGLEIPGLGKQTPNEVYKQNPDRLLEYVKTYTDPSFL